MARILYPYLQIKNTSEMNKISLILLLFLFRAPGFIQAQETPCTLNECMRYAVANSPKIKKQIYANDNYRQDHRAAVASLFPSMSGNIDLTTNFGRSIDPETNVYSNTSNLSNQYQLSAGLPLFNAGVLINTIRITKINRFIGIEKKRQIEDEISIQTIQAYADAVYYRKTITLAEQKLTESKRTLYKTRRMEELGLKGKADVAQIEAQVAADDYALTHQQNQYDQALITLKSTMNYPASQPLTIDTALTEVPLILSGENPEEIYRTASRIHPAAKQADYSLKGYKLDSKIARGKLFPSLSLNGGIGTNYYDILTGETDKDFPGFRDQFKNNRGEWIRVTLSIPLFNGLSRKTSLNKARNNEKIARQEQIETLRLLQDEIEKTVQERDGLAKEIIQMKKQVEANRLAYEVTRMKYEKGLVSALDLQTSSNNLLLSQANQVQVLLSYRIKCKLVDYYKGIPLIEKE